MTETVEQLRFAVGAFLAELKDDTVSANRIINPLLNLWQLATEVDSAAAAPLEELLSVISQRNLIARSELSNVLDRVLAGASSVQAAGAPS